MDLIRRYAAKISESPILDRLFALLGVGLGLLALINAEAKFTNLLIFSIFLLGITYFIVLVAAQGAGAGGLAGTRWHSYHLTRNNLTESAPAWVEGSVTFKKSSSFNKITALHEDEKPPRHRYKMTGHTDNGVLLLIEKNSNPTKKDDCLAYFPHLADVHDGNLEHGIIAGFWLGPDQSERTTIGPYILSRQPLQSDQLWGLASNLPLQQLVGSAHAAESSI